MVAAVCQTIRENLDKLTGDSRTRVALMTYDDNVQFFNMRATLAQPQMLVMTDTEQPFLPYEPLEMLVSLTESREVRLDGRWHSGEIRLCRS